MAIKVERMTGLIGRDSDIPKIRIIRRICVEGYDTSLPEFDVDAALRKHFASCGDVVHVYIPIEELDKPLNRFAFVYLRGKDAEEKALKLSGSKVEGKKTLVSKNKEKKIVGGWNLVVKAYPFHENYLDPELAPMRAQGQKNRRAMGVTVYDNSSCPVMVEEVKSMLKCLFPASGKIDADFDMPKSGGPLMIKCLLHLYGEDAVERALQLSGLEMRQRNVVVDIICGPPPPMIIG
ncbi:hypothetical protein EUTSA_v10026130mg [Eutrema salsugineum]|uniref:RRM domain-containing protein n=1 Tax=Eutrema salsugineum TaxID=72664 RepID=V4LVY0_EUTSA|nr:uncharacterized protein LOC18029844 isoform X2 [Eutrema salsugineum]ESQ54845.1 hypothetical protein EUTSA_v10026130mg [Eutrema salsugineum]